MLVDIGGGTTDVAIYYDNVIRHTAVIPFGGNMVTADIREGCSILQNRPRTEGQIRYAIGDIAPENKVVSIPGIAGREPKEISFKNLAYIIQSRMEEILDAVNFEIQNSGFAEKLTAGVVITGGGAMLKNLPQLVKYKTAMDVRLGHPNVHISGKGKDEINQPMYATSVGLILKGLEYIDENRVVMTINERKPEPAARHNTVAPPAKDPVPEPEMVTGDEQETASRRGPGGRITDRIKRFWDDIIDATDEKIDESSSN